MGYWTRKTRHAAHSLCQREWGLPPLSPLIESQKSCPYPLEA